jgi:superfamily II DNA or RNA helicase
MVYTETIHVKLADHTKLVLVPPSREIEEEIYRHFAFFAPNYKYAKTYKAGVWDGMTKLYNKDNGTLPAGLYWALRDFCAERDYTIEIHESPVYGNPKAVYDVSDDELDSFFQNLPLPFPPYKHQMDAVKHVIRSLRSLLVSPVGSGKSYIMYLVIRYLLSKVDGKALIIVPNTNLVGQMFGDFEEYSSADPNFEISENMAKIMAGRSKENLPKITVSTWQSIHMMTPDFFDQFEIVIGDEAHLFAAASTTKLMNATRRARWRIGATGTLKESKMHELQLQGLFGPTKNVATIKELQDKKILSQIGISIIRMTYPEEMKKELRVFDPKIKKTRYLTHIEENALIASLDKRNEFIAKLANSLQGNTLVLYRLVDKHGKPLHKKIQQFADCPTFFVSGATSADRRNEIRAEIEDADKSITVASYETFSTGMNAKNLRNIIFASPYKSKVKVIQSLGRTLRLSKDGKPAKLFDIVDELKSGQYIAATTRHGRDREKIYVKEKLPIKEKIEVKINDLRKTTEHDPV